MVIMDDTREDETQWESVAETETGVEWKGYNVTEKEIKKDKQRSVSWEREQCWGESKGMEWQQIFKRYTVTHSHYIDINPIYCAFVIIQSKFILSSLDHIIRWKFFREHNILFLWLLSNVLCVFL